MPAPKPDRWRFHPVGRGTRIELLKSQTVQGEAPEYERFFFTADELADFLGDGSRALDDAFREITK